LSHAFAVAGHAEKYRAALLPAAKLWQKTGGYLREQGDFERARISVEHALTIRSQTAGEESVVAAESLNYLGEIYQEQGNYLES
jgi:tetratricopeptide (TPR) repeat protein